MLKRIDDGSFHAGFAINAGATDALLAAAATATAPYDATSAVTFAFDEGRGGSLLGSMLPAINDHLMLLASNIVARALLADAAAAGAGAAALNPAVIVSPVGSTVANLHPVYATGAHTAVGLAFIDYWCELPQLHIPLHALASSWAGWHWPV